MHQSIFMSFRVAFEGIFYAFSQNRNLKTHFLAAFIVILASIFFQVNVFEMGVLGLVILLVIASEMINTALEEMVDLITTEHHRRAKAAKDVAAGMVLVTAIGAVIIGFLIFTPHIVVFLGRLGIKLGE